MENPAASCKQRANKIKLNYERNSLVLEQEKKMRKNRIALLLGIVLMFSLVLTGCRSAQKTVQPSYEGESVKPHMLKSTCFLTWLLPWAALGSRTWSSADTRSL